MTNELDELIELFCKYGGRFENMVVGHTQESGYYCSVVDSQRDAEVFCPAHLLVDVNDIGINETGLFIARPENYPDNIKFLEKYFSFHFNEKTVSTLLEEKRQIDSLSEHEKLLLRRIQLPYIIDGKDKHLEYARWRMLHSYEIGSESFGSKDKRVIMPFVSFLNHDRNGTPFNCSKNGVTVSGRFDGEVSALYHLGDTLMFLRDYGFVTDTRLVYSLPMQLTSHDGTKVSIRRNISNFQINSDGVRWPKVRKQDGLVIVSWFPIYLENGPGYPARFAEYLSREVNIPAVDILYTVFQYNLGQLLPIVFDLKDSKNSYVQTAVSGTKRQLELMGRML